MNGADLEMRLDYEEAATSAEPQMWEGQPGGQPDTCTVTTLLAIRLFRAFRAQRRAVRVSSRSLGLCEVEGVRRVGGRYVAPPADRQFGVAQEVLVWHEGSPERGAKHRVVEVVDYSDLELHMLLQALEANRAQYFTPPK